MAIKVFFLLVSTASAASAQLWHPHSHGKFRGHGHGHGHHHASAPMHHVENALSAASTSRTNITRKALECYTGDTLDRGELTTCADGEDMCFLRYEQDTATGGPLNNDVKRYCSSTQRCKDPMDKDLYTPDGFMTLATQECKIGDASACKKVVFKCCPGAGCNGATPAVVDEGLFDIQQKGSDKYVAMVNGKLVEVDFSNDENLKFRIQRVGSSDEGHAGEYSIAPVGSTDETEQSWTVLEAQSGEYEIFGKTAMAGIMSILGTNPSDLFTFKETVEGPWVIGWEGKRCPKSVLQHGVTGLQDCVNKCKASQGCKDIIEWEHSKPPRCHFVIAACPAAEMTSEGGFTLFKSKCAGVTCTPISQCHVAGQCQEDTGLCTNPLMDDGSTCDDGDVTSGQDKCTAGECKGQHLCLKACTAPTQCHDAGTCNYETGQCSVTSKPGAQCDDKDQLTMHDICITVGNEPVCKGQDLCAVHKEAGGCKAKSQCHEAGECNYLTGLCSEPLKSVGTKCDDGDDTTKDDECTAEGACRGVAKCDKVTCAPLGACYTAGTCNSKTGQCDDPFAPSGGKCDDLNQYTVEDQCDGKGGCAGKDLCATVTCPQAPLGACEVAGSCDPLNGKCHVSNKANGVPCDDGDSKTSGDKCEAGKCVGVDLCAVKDCTQIVSPSVAIASCHDASASTCDHATGACISVRKPDDDACDDGDDFTKDDKCKAGLCVGLKVDKSTPAPSPAQVEVVKTAAEVKVTKFESALGKCQALFTNWDAQGHKNSQALRRHPIECPEGQVLNGWKLKKKNKKVRVKYWCCEMNSRALGECTDHQTGVASRGQQRDGNSVVHFDAHNVRCGGGKMMTGWKLVKLGQDQKFEFKCCGAIPNLGDCEDKETDSAEHKGGKLYKLRLHKSKCKKTEVLQGWQLDRGGGKMSIKYSCCKAPQIPVLDTKLLDTGLLQDEEEDDDSDFLEWEKEENDFLQLAGSEPAEDEDGDDLESMF